MFVGKLLSLLLQVGGEHLAEPPDVPPVPPPLAGSQVTDHRGTVSLAGRTVVLLPCQVSK